MLKMQQKLDRIEKHVARKLSVETDIVALIVLINVKLEHALEKTLFAPCTVTIKKEPTKIATECSFWFSQL